MLQYLRVENLGLMQKAVLEFDSGFTTVTGETGAGKSVLLGALQLLSGARADKSLIRQNSDTLSVEAGLYFENSDTVNKRLVELNLPICEEGSLILSRTFSQTKMPKIQINGNLTTLANLQKMGEIWIDFHGPGEPQKLFHQKWQLSLLDLYSKTYNLLDNYIPLYRDWKIQLKKIDEIKNSDQLTLDEADYIRSQLDLFEQIDLSTEAIEKLENKFNRLNKSQEIIQISSLIMKSISDDDGITAQLGTILNFSRELSQLDHETVSLSDRVESLIIEIEDLASEYNLVTNESEFSEEDTADLTKQMELWLELKRKFGGDINLILEKQKKLAEKLNDQSNIEETLLRLKVDVEKLESQLFEIAENIRVKRISSAKSLSTKVLKLVNKLGFKNAKFEIDVVRESELKECGNSTCNYQFASNFGQKLMPLNKIASSGEIARVMLALKAVLADVDDTPVLVFDEVDANIGGEIAGIVGEKLSELGKRHQVFCVTHQPQVAARGDNHLVVTKIQKKNDVAISINSIHKNPHNRKIEIARMLGDRSSSSALNHAEELLVN